MSSYHHKSGAQKRKAIIMRVEVVKGQKMLQQHGFDVAEEDCEGSDCERNQCSSVPSKGNFPFKNRCPNKNRKGG